MQNDLPPDYLSSLKPTTVGSTSAYSLHNLTNLHTVRPNSQLYFNSFLLSVIRDWNELPEEIRSSASLSVFKHKLNRDSKMPSKFYFIGKRLSQIYHARLRTNCSSLNQHLFSKNLIDNPLCICGSAEDTYHFLLTCNRFSNLRQELFNKVSTICRPTLNVFFYGNDELSMKQNKDIFLAVQNYLLNTKRFQIN